MPGRPAHHGRTAVRQEAVQALHVRFYGRVGAWGHVFLLLIKRNAVIETVLPQTGTAGGQDADDAARAGPWLGEKGLTEGQAAHIAFLPYGNMSGCCGYGTFTMAAGRAAMGSIKGKGR